jgi:hypothetical protein
MPGLQKLTPVKVHEALDLTQFVSSKSARCRQFYLIDPELGMIVFSPHMNMRSFDCLAA